MHRFILARSPLAPLSTLPLALLFALLVLASTSNSAIAHSHSKSLSEPTGKPVIFASIKPLQMLLQSVLGSSAQAELLIDPKFSPHHYSPKPSQLKRLQKADGLFYISNEFEVFMPKLSRSLPKHVALWSVLGMEQGSSDEYHDDGDDHDEHGHHDDDDDHHDHHDHGGVDMHLWMDPNRAQDIIRLMRDKLSKAYPQNRSLYQRNSAAAIQRIEQADKELQASLRPVQKVPFMVYHDAYQYFVDHYGLNLVAAVMTGAHHPLSAKRIAMLRKQIKEQQVACLFSEPQFPEKVLLPLTEGSNVKIASLDPLGSDLTDSAEDTYVAWLRNLAGKLKACLAKHTAR